MATILHFCCICAVTVINQRCCRTSYEIKNHAIMIKNGSSLHRFCPNSVLSTILFIPEVYYCFQSPWYVTLDLQKSVCTKFWYHIDDTFKNILSQEREIWLYRLAWDLHRNICDFPKHWMLYWNLSCVPFSKWGHFAGHGSDKPVLWSERLPVSMDRMARHFLSTCTIIAWYVQLLTHWGRDKWRPFCRRHFQMHFQEYKWLNFA